MLLTDLTVVSPDTIEVQKIDIAPNPALIQAELRLVVAFTSAREVNNAKWELKVSATGS